MRYSFFTRHKIPAFLIPLVFLGVLVAFGNSISHAQYPTPWPEPALCDKLWSGTVTPQGFGAPYNILSQAKETLIRVLCTSSSAFVKIGTGDQNQYIYSKGYVAASGGGGWTSIDFTSSEQMISNAWFPKNASAEISLTAEQLSGGNNSVLAYVCTWTGGQWKCGCRDASCTQHMWQIQQFKKNPAVSPTPTPTPSPSTTASNGFCGKVTIASGVAGGQSQAVAGARVEAYKEAGSTLGDLAGSATTGTDGSYQINLQPGYYRIVIPGYHDFPFPPAGVGDTNTCTLVNLTIPAP